MYKEKVVLSCLYNMAAMAEDENQQNNPEQNNPFVWDLQELEQQQEQVNKQGCQSQNQINCTNMLMILVDTCSNRAIKMLGTDQQVKVVRI